jgi:hypothetical protein
VAKTAQKSKAGIRKADAGSAGIFSHYQEEKEKTKVVRPRK